MQRGGAAVDDPVSWWNSLPDDVVTYWQAFDLVEPINGQDERHAYLCHLLDNILAALLNQHLTKENWSKRYKPRSPDEFMPNAARTKKQDKKPSLISQLNAYGNHYKPVQRRSDA